MEGSQFNSLAIVVLVLTELLAYGGVGAAVFNHGKGLGDLFDILLAAIAYTNRQRVRNSHNNKQEKQIK